LKGSENTNWYETVFDIQVTLHTMIIDLCINDHCGTSAFLNTRNH